MESRPDLSAELTVFVLTVGAPSFAECVQRLEAQDCRFALEVIENVAPMSRALQCMLDRCGTRFFVQVDEDMLYPHAIRSLYTRLTESRPVVAILTCHLFDPHAERVIYGLKIYALMGVIAGRLAPVDGRGREKDYQDYERLPGFRALVRFVEEAAAEPNRK